MKITLDDIKDRLRRRLIEYDGNIAPHNLADIIEDARAIGLEEKDIARLVPELDKSINWSLIREEKRVEQEMIRMQEREKLHDSELMQALVNSIFSDGIVEQLELEVIFRKVTELQQDELEIARIIMNKVHELDYKPYPNADLNATSMKEMLLSTSWYGPKKYAAAVRRKKAAVKPVPAPEPEPAAYPHIPIPVIHRFEASKTKIIKGERITIYWEVSGVDSFRISGLGKSNLLKGQKVVTPEASTTYTLTAGHATRSLSITVEDAPKAVKWAIWILTIILLILLGKCVS